MCARYLKPGEGFVSAMIFKCDPNTKQRWCSEKLAAKPDMLSKNDAGKKRRECLGGLREC
jgi:hypothetical protein